MNLSHVVRTIVIKGEYSCYVKNDIDVRHDAPVALVSVIHSFAKNAKAIIKRDEVDKLCRTHYDP